MKRTLITVLFAFLLPILRADEPQKLALIRELLVLTDVKGTLEKSRVDNVAQTRAALVQQAGEQAGNETMKRLIDRVMQKYAEYSKEIFDYPRHETEYTAFYQAEFTEKQLQALVAFYKSDAGRTLTRAQPRLLMKLQSAAFQRTTQQADRIDRMMRETIAEVQAEMKKEGKAQ